MPAAATSMSDGLMQILTTLAGLKVTPDANMDLLNNLEALIVSGVQQSQAADLEGQLSSLNPSPPSPMGGGVGMDMAPMGGPPGMGGPPPGPGGMPGGPGMPPGPGQPMGARLPMAPAPPNPDELRRILSLG
jgi:hypothetical protein